MTPGGSRNRYRWPMRSVMQRNGYILLFARLVIGICRGIINSGELPLRPPCRVPVHANRFTAQPAFGAPGRN
jgi:hypothetical protein